MSNIDGNITIILLAAGQSQRFGSSKQLATIDGVPMVRRAALVALQSLAKQVIVVIGAYHDQVRNVLSDLPLTIIYNPDWEKGMGSSIRIGMQESLKDNPVGVMVCLADQPAITTTDLNHMISMYHKLQQTIACNHNGQPGAPAIFDCTSYPQLSNMSGKDGARAILSDNSSVYLLQIASASIDIDTTEDLKRNAL